MDKEIEDENAPVIETGINDNKLPPAIAPQEGETEVVEVGLTPIAEEDTASLLGDTVPIDQHKPPKQYLADTEDTVETA